MNVYRYVLYEYISLLIVVFSATFLFWKELVLFQLFFFKFTVTFSAFGEP